MTTGSKEAFIIFQVHDGRFGCSPPMSLRWQGNGTLSFDSDYTKGKGMDGCIENRSLRNASFRGPPLRRDGTRYQLQVATAFDGEGSFDVSVTVDGRPVLSGTYSPPNEKRFLRSKRFYMKHGVYSRNRWDYELRSEQLQVQQLRR